MGQAVEGGSRNGRSGRFDRLKIASPCEESWERMVPLSGERSRHCDRCQKAVHDFRQSTLLEIEALLSRRGSELCARLTHDAAGHLIFRPDARPASQEPAIESFRAPAAAVLLSAVLGAAPAAADGGTDSGELAAALDPAIEPELGESVSENPDELAGYASEVSGGAFELVTSGVIAFVEPSLLDQFAAAPLVVLATVGETRAIAVENGFGTVESEIAIDLVIKGEAGLGVHPFRYMADLGNEAFASSTVLPFGETVLLFLQPIREGESTHLEIADVYRTPRVLGPGEARVYRQRLLELADLAAGETVEPREMLDWLVAMVADPATRHEAIGDLVAVFDAGEDEREAEAAESGAGEAAADEAEPAEPVEPEQGGASSSLDAALNPERLAPHLVPEDAERLARGLAATRRLVAADLALYDLVARWSPETAQRWLRREARAAALAIAEGERDSYEDVDWIRVGEALGDDEIVRLAEASGERLESRFEDEGEEDAEASAIDPEAIVAAIEEEGRALAAGIADRLAGDR